MEDLLKVQVISPEMKMYRITLLIKAMMSQNLQYELRKLLNHGIRIILRSDISKNQDSFNIGCILKDRRGNPRKHFQNYECGI
jgi:hypothetical protein